MGAVIKELIVKNEGILNEIDDLDQINDRDKILNLKQQSFSLSEQIREELKKLIEREVGEYYCPRIVMYYDIKKRADRRKKNDQG